MYRTIFKNINRWNDKANIKVAKRSKLNKVTQMKEWSKIKAWWYFALIFSGMQANNPHLMSRSKSTDARLARPYICASWPRQLIGNTRQQVGKNQDRRFTKLWRMVSHSPDVILQSVWTKCQSDANFKISEKNILKNWILNWNISKHEKIFLFVKKSK